MSTMKMKLSVLAVVACCVVSPLASAQNCTGAVPFPCPTEPVDFCTLADDTVAYFVPGGMFEWLADLLGSDAAIITQLYCETSDINGNPVPDFPSANGLLDHAELLAVTDLINDPSPYSGLGAWTGNVGPGFVTNYQNLYTTEMNTLVTITLPSLWPVLTSLLAAEDPPIIVPPLTPDVQAAITGLFPDLMALLGAFAVLGDADTMAAVLEVANLLALCDLLTPGSCMVNDIETDPLNYATFPNELGLAGNADGDALTNQEEYANAFAKVMPANAPCYRDAMLDPALDGTECAGGTEGEGEGEGEGEVMLYPGIASVVEGGMLDVIAETTLTGTITWTWVHSTLGEIGDGTGNLVIPTVDSSYNGTVTVTADDGTKATAQATLVISVAAAGTLPLAGGLGIGMLAGACALGGAILIRRKR